MTIYGDNYGDQLRMERQERLREDAQERYKENNQGADIFSLQQDVERLLLITEGLWSFIKRHHGYKDKDLYEVVNAIDARDGQIDGKLAKTNTPEKCPECGRTLPRRKPFCSYCGTKVVRGCFDR